MQIISGAHRGRKLYLPAGARPTQNLARGAIFNIITPMLGHDAMFTVWDAFAGSGAFGIEFLSRYPNVRVIFTDNSPTSVDTVRRNLRLISAGENATICAGDAIAVIPRFGANSDIIFVDPPYSNFELGVRFVKKLTPVARTGTILIWEIESATHQLPETNDFWEILQDRTYGRARFLILRRSDNK